MMRLLKASLHKALNRCQRWLLYSPPGQPTGWDLRHDLRLILPKPDPLIFDVGANVGQSIELFSGIWERPVIHAFEPTPSCFEKLREGKWKAQVHLHQMAIGDAEGTLPFFEYEMPVLNSTLQLDPGMKERFQNVKPTRQTEVRVRPLDAVCAELGISQVDLLKTDTQGFDLHVLRGARKLFEAVAVRAVIVELNHGVVYQNQDRMLDILQFLEGHRYMLVDLYEKFRRGPYIEWSTALFVRADERAGD